MDPRRFRALALGLVFAVVLSAPIHAWAQEPARSAPNIVTVVETMRTYTQGLGVECIYCHVDGQNGRLNYRSDDNPRKQVARKMIAMTADINTMIGLGRSEHSTTRVTCLTCHRGVPDPRPLNDIIREKMEREGGQAAADHYRALRQRFFGGPAYDFREELLLTTVQTFVDGRPDEAIELLKMNLEFYPQSSRGYSALAYAYTRRRDDPSAMTALEKALDLDPDNSIARGQLEQLKKYQRRR
ncbi:MAG: c-type cytochrome [Acidimicrobiia bacterium]|nr:c-type cytochrome [Acidimicrobiia bacterium]